MRQRVMIALALACGPELMIGDEPTTALDVMTQGQILHLLEELRRDLGLALLLITHDLSVIAETCDRVAIMYAGQIAEQGPVRDIIENPQHPYTARLLSGFSHVGGPRTLGEAIPGSPPHPGEDFPGCRFAPRCHLAFADCVKAPDPALQGQRRPRGALSAGQAAMSAGGQPGAIYEARGLHITYQRGRRAARARRRRRRPGVAARRDARPRGRVGLRQVDACARAARPREAERREHRVRRPARGSRPAASCAAASS